MASLPSQVGVSQEDIESIRRAALDYLEGYVSADAPRHLGAYHPEAIKRRYTVHDEVFGITTISPQTMSDDAALQTPRDVGDFEILIDGVYHDIATVRVYSQWWVDFLHVVKARGSWKLFHVTWHRRVEPDSPH
ncbi:MAG: nuclear transport factor 2 family protein [Actinobacteria bacterium]|nr:nuclear transport factor 2 family protein [Actinomycetota bacterium]MCI0678063.1 nuclear transport factor 2 family protein [Actinomycetota bacterium]